MKNIDIIKEWRKILEDDYENCFGYNKATRETMLFYSGHKLKDSEYIETPQEHVDEDCGVKLSDHITDMNDVFSEEDVTTIKLSTLYNTVIKYLSENNIKTYEDVYQSNKIENTATDLIDSLLSIVKEDLDLSETYEWRFCKECHFRIFKDELEGDTILTVKGELYCIECANELLNLEKDQDDVWKSINQELSHRWSA